jgi:hypothetical protein
MSLMSRKRKMAIYMMIEKITEGLIVVLIIALIVVWWT